MTYRKIASSRRRLQKKSSRRRVSKRPSRRPRRSTRRSPRKSPRKSPRRSPRKSPRRSPRRSSIFKFANNEKQVDLIIYTIDGCPACENAKKLCKENNIKFKALLRADHSEYVDKNTDNCEFVPNIFYKGKYIGGYNELEEFVKKMKNAKQ